MTNRELDRFSNSKSIDILPTSQTNPNDRTIIKPTIHRLAQISLAITLFLIPVRFRWVLLNRPIGPIYGDYTNFILFISDLFLIATVMLWLISLRKKPDRINFGPNFLTLPIFGLTGLSLISVFSSFDPQLSLYHSLRLLLLGGLYLFLINEDNPVNLILIPIGLQVTTQAMISVAQHLNQSSLGLQSIGELELNPEWQGVSIVWAQGTRLLRAYGLSDHPNLLGGSLAFGLLVTMVWFLKSKSVWRPLIVGGFGTGILALFLTFSRSAWLAFASGSLLATALIYKYRNRARFYQWIGLALSGLVITIPFLWANAQFLGARVNWNDSFQLIPFEEQAIGERQLLVKAGNQIFLENPITGVGLGSFPQALRNKQPDFPVDYQPVHFTLLDAAVETGIFGGLLYVYLIAAPWIVMMVNRKSLEWSLELIGVSALLMAITIVGFFDYYTWLLPSGRLWQWLAWGLWGSVYQSSRHRSFHE